MQGTETLLLANKFGSVIKMVPADVAKWLISATPEEIILSMRVGAKFISEPINVPAKAAPAIVHAPILTKSNDNIDEYIHKFMCMRANDFSSDIVEKIRNCAILQNDRESVLCVMSAINNKFNVNADSWNVTRGSAVNHRANIRFTFERMRTNVRFGLSEPILLSDITLRNIIREAIDVSS